MNRFEIRDILNQHKEHFRVLPTNALNDLMGIIRTIDDEAVSKADVVELKPEKPSDLGNRTRKSKKKSSRPGR